MAGAAFLTGCAGGAAIPVRVDVSCAIAKPIDMSDQTIAWLGKDGDPPDYVQADLDKVGRQNCKLREICLGEKPPECGAKP